MSNFRQPTRVLLLAIATACCGGRVERCPADEDEVPFSHETIDHRPPERPWFKMAGDIDGDGDLDIVVAGANGPLVWYSHPDWQKREIAGGTWNGVNGELADIDADGDTDVIMGGVVWFDNPQIGGASWRLVRVDDQRAHDIEVGDIDLDGRLDIVARDQSAFGKAGNAIYLYHQVNPHSWTRNIVPCPHGEGLRLGDIDLDGDLDIVTGGRWFENTRMATGQRWREHTYTADWTEPDAKVELADINLDGRPDVVLTPAELRGETYKVAWYEAPPDPTAGNWSEHLIVPAIECVIHSLGVGDFDHDGDFDVAIAEMHQGTDPDKVSLLLNLDNGTRWTEQVLSASGSHDIVVADVDDDGDLDIIGANHDGVHPLELWRNNSTPRRR